MGTADDQPGQDWDNLARTVANEAARVSTAAGGGGGDDAEELAADVLLRLLKYRDQVHTRGPLLALAQAIARNLRIDRARQRKSRGVPARLDDMPEPAGAAPGTLAGAERQELLDALAAALTPEQRLLVRLCLVDGKTLRQAAAAAGMPEATLRRRLQAAVDMMEHVRREWMGD